MRQPFLPCSNDPNLTLTTFYSASFFGFSHSCEVTNGSAMGTCSLQNLVTAVQTAVKSLYVKTRIHYLSEASATTRDEAIQFGSTVG